MYYKNNQGFELSQIQSPPLFFQAAYFFNPRREVLNEQLAQVVEGLEFAGLRSRQMERR